MSSFIVTGMLLVGPTSGEPFGLSGSASATLSVARAPAYVMRNFSTSSKQSGGGAGTVHTDVFMVNVGPSCRLIPMRARAYSLSARKYVGTASYIVKPMVSPANVFPYATTHLLGLVSHAQQVSLDVGYTDVAIGQPDCGEQTIATAVAFWITGHPGEIKVARVVMGGSKSFLTCSARPYFFVYWPSTGAFQPGA